MGHLQSEGYCWPYRRSLTLADLGRAFSKCEVKAAGRTGSKPVCDTVNDTKSNVLPLPKHFILSQKCLSILDIMLHHLFQCQGHTTTRSVGRRLRKWSPKMWDRNQAINTTMKYTKKNIKQK